MPADSLNQGGFNVRGHVKIWRIDEATGAITQIGEKSNQIQVWWGHISAKQLGFRRQPDRDDYVISGMYFEYENQTDPTVAVATTSFDRNLGVAYYTGLATNPKRDFLRVPLRLEPALGVSAGSEGETALVAAGLSNKLTFFAQTAGAQGANGKTFSHITNSKVFSAALVAMPRIDDRTRDVVFARINFDAGDQTIKEASSQIGLSWDIAFE